MWYSYHQNNSGGAFEVDDAVDQYVWIEAESAEDADSRAESIGIYFDGCDAGRDCSCCGDRWMWAWDTPTAKPELYGEKLIRRKGHPLKYFQDTQINTTFHLYHADGSHERITVKLGKVVGHERG